MSQNSEQSDREVGQYVTNPNKKRRMTVNAGCDGLSSGDIDALVAEKVREILQQNQCAVVSNVQKNTANTGLIPPFDPENADSTAVNWTHKIEQIGLINNWDDETKSFCMQSRLSGLAQVWYNGLTDYNLTWDEWKNALYLAFPSHEDFVDLLKRMLSRRKMRTETIMHYFYEKNILVKRCGLEGTRAVSCIIEGLPTEIQGSAKAGNYTSPEKLYYGYLSKIDSNDSGNKERSDETGNLRCHLCRKIGHKARHCGFKGTMRGGDILRKPSIQCSVCGKGGHLDENCWLKTKKRCSACGKTGHDSQYCWSRRSGTSTTSTCAICKKVGHSAGNCWSKGKIRDVQMLKGQVLDYLYNITEGCATRNKLYENNHFAMISPRISTGSPRISTGSPRISTGSPRISTVSPRISTGSPRISTVSPRISTVSPRISTGSPRISSISPRKTFGLP